PPGAEVVAKAIRITTFLHIVHLLKNGRMKLAEHAFPIGVFIRPGKEPVHQFYETIKYGDIETDYAFEVGTLNFDGDFFAREQTRAINLAQRSRGDWFVIDFGVTLRERLSQFRFNARESFGGRKRRHAILKRRQLLYVGKRQQVSAR